MSGVYDIPAAYVRGRGAVTNTVPTTPYRSAGRPEVMFVIERLIDLAADRLGLDPVALRRRNLVPARRAALHATRSASPTTAAITPAAMETALTLADWNGFPARRAEAQAARQAARHRPRQLRRDHQRRAARAHRGHGAPDGRVELVMGTMSSGQGHETSFAQLVTEWLGVPFDSDRLRRARHRAGVGRRRFAFRPLDEACSHGHRPGDRRDHRQGPADRRASVRSQRCRHRVRRRALSRRRHRPRDRHLRGRRRGGTRSDLPNALRGPLAAISDQTLPVASFPYGTQICEVEVDPETGAVEIVRYAAVDDVGRAVNPLILHGQTHGGYRPGRRPGAV